MIKISLFYCKENIDYWEKVNETSLPEKEIFIVT